METRQFKAWIGSTDFQTSWEASTSVETEIMVTMKISNGD